jgi:hypothetical protein
VSVAERSDRVSAVEIENPSAGLGVKVSAFAPYRFEREQRIDLP